MRLAFIIALAGCMHAAVFEPTDRAAITSVLDDSQYLQQPWVRTNQFRKQTDAKGWNPTPCIAK